MMYTKFTDEMWWNATTAKEAKYWGKQKDLEMKCYFEEMENDWTLFDITADNRLVTKRYFGKEI